MADGTPSGWLPPRAPGARPEPAPERPAPVFAHATAARGERNRAAIWALALGIAGLVLLVLSLGTLFAITLPCSVAAWLLAARAQREIESGRTRDGEGRATAALWLGRIGVLAGVIAAVVLIALIASGFDIEQFRDELERELEQRRRQDGGGGGGGGDVRVAAEQLRAAVAAWGGR
jgi:hypothetical protein